MTNVTSQIRLYLDCIVYNGNIVDPVGYVICGAVKQMPLLNICKNYCKVFSGILDKSNASPDKRS